jgi:SAM-dependent methyltransferase
VKSRLIRAARQVLSRVAADHVRYQGLVLPAKHLRLCGSRFWDDAYFLASAQAEVERLIRHLGLNRKSRVLDVGCGVGRLALGILSRVGEIEKYRGIDVSAPVIDWCGRYLTPEHPGFQFVHIDVHNPRYNPGGQTINPEFQLPFAEREFDIIYLYSVFSHMTTGDVRAYLREFRRLLDGAGRVFLTGFFEEGVPEMSVNPEGYRRKWSGELHCVRYHRGFFESLAGEQGFQVGRFDYGQDTDGQSAMYLSLRGSGDRISSP